VIQTQFGRIPDQQVEQLISEDVFLRPSDLEADIERTPFRMRGGGIRAGNITPARASTRLLELVEAGSSSGAYCSPMLVGFPGDGVSGAVCSDAVPIASKSILGGLAMSSM